MEVTSKLPLYFLKFGRKQDLESLCNGSIYTNNADYFYRLEKETKIKKCIGDEHELKVPMKAKKAILKSDQFEIPFNDSKLEFYYKKDMTKAMFCLYSLYDDDFIFCEEENCYKLNLSDDKKRYMLNFFYDGERDSVLFIKAGNLIKEIEQTCQKENINVIHDNVIFYDVNVPYKEQIEDFMNRQNRRFFWKDIYYKEQCEYRFIFDKDIDEGQVLFNIGDIFKGNVPIKITDFIQVYEVILNP
ncbi:hypothetical protein [Clostridium sp. 'White wine YQ']|uniref:hypothetical protein n=1 Tax=Clostridium sp. 'White wine YQ' TaxID=3027474 RepID=UPI002365354D|nr:hypothetical protein [Clostridium sp. 'White wine YQ']MDD7793679.1 hypothetical protein [Clostridium sp. 'White wine YQ']